MIVAILTDIHANREALDACLADARERGAERFVLLGDTVGYGADPAYAVDAVMALERAGAVVLMGNHDAAVLATGRSMNAAAHVAIDWTRNRLDRAQLAFLAARPFVEVEGERLYVHADASAPKRWIYVTSAHEARHSMAATRARITFCGHVHRPQLYSMAAWRRAEVHAFEADTTSQLENDRHWLAVVGAVGQPRDGDPRACYCLFDDRKATLVLRRVAYDIGAAAAKIRAAGLPEILAERLHVGL